MQRNRAHKWLRHLVAEHTLSINDLILPLFIVEETRRVRESPVQGINYCSIEELLFVVEKALCLGIGMVALFPVIKGDLKSLNAEEAYNPDNLICRAIRKLRKNFKDEIGICVDVALDPYTTHGHDGVLRGTRIDNDQTIDILCRQALVQAAAQCDVIAPSDMMDGRIGIIRRALDNSNFHNIAILSYAVKYASSFYQPFRKIMDTATNNLDKSTYQMDYHNSREAMREITLDIDEGADMIMIKPALPYLDIIHQAKQNFTIPIFAYQVSGEYAMLKTGAQNNLLNYQDVLYETLIAIKRAGAQAIFTYAALEIAALLRK